MPRYPNIMATFWTNGTMAGMSGACVSVDSRQSLISNLSSCKVRNILAVAAANALHKLRDNILKANLLCDVIYLA